MNKIHHNFKNIIHKIKNIPLTTPLAIILGAIMISISILGYGFIMSSGTDTSKNTNPLPKILKDSKLNKKDFMACVNSGVMASAVASSTQDGVLSGVDGTPTTFVIKQDNGIPYVVAAITGAENISVFKQAIDQAISTNSVAKLKRFNGKPVTNDDVQEMTNPTNIYVVEYSDPECPYCIKLHDTMKQIRTDYAGKISFVYRHFPLPFHQHAEKEAEMIECAGKLGGATSMYKYIDEIFDYKIKNNVGFIPIDNQ